MGMASEFFVKMRKIGSGLTVFVDTPRSRPEQGLFQSSIIPAFGQRPGHARRMGAFQILINLSVSDRATAGDLPLPQPELVAESQYFFELSHGQPFRWQCGPSTFQWSLIADLVVQRPSPCGNLSEMIPVRVPTTGET